jgi:hypothetical protein
MFEGIIGAMGKGIACRSIEILIAGICFCECFRDGGHTALAATIRVVTLGLTVNVWLVLMATIPANVVAFLVRTAILSPCIWTNKNLENLPAPVSGGSRP